MDPLTVDDVKEQLLRELDKREAKAKSWMAKLDQRMDAEETATIRLQEREGAERQHQREIRGTVHWATLKAVFGILTSVMFIVISLLVYYVAGEINAVSKPLTDFKGVMERQIENIDREMDGLASKSSVENFTNTLAGKASASGVSSLATELQLLRSETSGDIDALETLQTNASREIESKIDVLNDKTQGWQQDFAGQFTTFRINTNDKLARIDILCSLIRQTKTEIRKLDAINNQSVSALYSVHNALRQLVAQAEVQVPERPGETGRDVDAC